MMYLRHLAALAIFMGTAIQRLQEGERGRVLEREKKLWLPGMAKQQRERKGKKKSRVE